MASTYTYTEVWNVARQQFRVGNEPTIWEYATNMAISKMWTAYDWRGTVSELEPFWLVPGQQDYGTPFYSVPDDFFGLREVYLVDTSDTNIPTRRALRVVENLERTNYQGWPNVICYRPSISGFRIHPAASTSTGSPNVLVDGTYKIRPPKITRALQASTLLWDDVYFETFVQSLAWAALLASGERKAAAEQFMVFKQSLMESTGVENLEDGEPSIAPAEAFIPSSGGLIIGPWGF